MSINTKKTTEEYKNQIFKLDTNKVNNIIPNQVLTEIGNNGNKITPFLNNTYAVYYYPYNKKIVMMFSYNKDINTVIYKKKIKKFEDEYITKKLDRYHVYFLDIYCLAAFLNKKAIIEYISKKPDDSYENIINLKRMFTIYCLTNNETDMLNLLNINNKDIVKTANKIHTTSNIMKDYELTRSIIHRTFQPKEKLNNPKNKLATAIIKKREKMYGTISNKLKRDEKYKIDGKKPNNKNNSFEFPLLRQDHWIRLKEKLKKSILEFNFKYSSEFSNVSYIDVIDLYKKMYERGIIYAIIGGNNIVIEYILNEYPKYPYNYSDILFTEYKDKSSLLYNAVKYKHNDTVILILEKYRLYCNDNSDNDKIIYKDINNKSKRISEDTGLEYIDVVNYELEISNKLKLNNYIVESLKLAIYYQHIEIIRSLLLSLDEYSIFKVLSTSYMKIENTQIDEIIQEMNKLYKPLNNIDTFIINLLIEYKSKKTKKSVSDFIDGPKKSVSDFIDGTKINILYEKNEPFFELDNPMSLFKKSSTSTSTSTSTYTSTSTNNPLLKKRQLFELPRLTISNELTESTGSNISNRLNSYFYVTDI